MIWGVAYGQSTIYIRGDSVRFQGPTNSEFILLNSTRNVSNGFLKNLGNGRTAFATVPAGDSLFGYKDIIATAQRTFNLNSNNFIYTGNGQIILNNTFTSPNAKLKVVGDNSTQHLASFGDSTQDWTFDGSGSFAIRKKHNVAIAAGASQPENTFLVVRQMDLDSGVYLNGFYAAGRVLQEYRVRQAARVHSWGNDFGTLIGHLQIRKAEGYTGYSTIGTASDASVVQAMSAVIGLVQMRGSTGPTNGMRATGWWNGVAADLVKTADDTLSNVAMFMTMGVNAGKVNRLVDYYAYYSGVSTNDTGIAFYAPHRRSYSFFQQAAIGSDLDGEFSHRPNDPSAIFDVWSKTRGILFPRMTTTQRDAISSPATGLHISNTDSLGKLDYYNGSIWVGYGASSGGGGSATTIYNGNGALSSDRTVDGDANDLFFTDMEAFRIYGTGVTYGSVRLFETSGSAGTISVGRSGSPYTTWSDSIRTTGLSLVTDTALVYVHTLNKATGAWSYSPWLYAGGGGGTPGGLDTYMQYNDGGAFGGDAGATYNETTNTLTLTGSINLPSSTSEGIKRAGTTILYDNGSVGRWSPGGGNGQLFTSGSNGLLSVFNSAGSNSMVLDGSGILYRSASPLQIQTTGNVGIGTGGTSATARLHLPAGTATASTAPLKFTAGTFLTTIEAFAKEANANGVYQTSNALNRYAEGGYIADFFTEVNNVTTTETDLYSYTTKANTFAADGEKLFAEFSGITTGHATATRTWQIYFGGASISTSASFFTGIDASGLDWKIKVTGVRRSSSSIVWVIEYSIGSTGVTSVSDVAIQTGLTLSGTNVFKLTGQAGAAGAGSDQIKAQSGIISWYGASNN